MLTLLTATLSTTCLIAPSAAHRLRFHQADREWLIESANAWMLSGLVLLALALSGVVLLISDVLYDGARVWIYTGVVASALLFAWFIRPALRKAHRDRQRPAQRA